MYVLNVLTDWLTLVSSDADMIVESPDSSRIGARTLRKFTCEEALK
jgi:hypothetical protein